MRVGCRYLAVSALILLCGVAAFAATDKAQVYGNVIDINSKGLPGIRVVLTSDKIKLVKEVVTDPDGSYVITDVPPADDYRLSAFRDKNAIDSTSFELSVGEAR